MPMSADGNGRHGGSRILGTVKQRGAVVVDGLRSRLWPVPALGVVAAVLAGISIPELDSAVDAQLPQTLAGYLFGGGADAARGKARRAWGRAMASLQAQCAIGRRRRA